MTTTNGIPDDIIVHAVRSLAGEVTPVMRAVAFGYDGKTARFRFFTDRQPSAEDEEHGEIVAVNFDAGVGNRLEALEVEFVESNQPLRDHDTLQFILFSRHEDWSEK